jgi:hypothetical protein
MMAIELEDGGPLGNWCCICHDMKALAHFKAERDALRLDFAAFRATALETSNHLHDVIRERDALRAQAGRLMLQVRELSTELDSVHSELGGQWERADTAEIQAASLYAATQKVLTEAGLQAHTVGCPNRLMRVRLASSTGDPCPACLAETVLRDLMLDYERFKLERSHPAPEQPKGEKP